jgi:hypothetical protein
MGCASRYVQILMGATFASVVPATLKVKKILSFVKMRTSVRLGRVTVSTSATTTKAGSAAVAMSDTCSQRMEKTALT